ncbi:rhodanese-like domain-containing protein [Afifella sp. YEN Y35]|uniref:rhodanese-like domain-containing protein n=1 Tax=Afifella sp. YEN Y35 TaxID=3388337 RepID=UPI0039E17E96
MPQQIVKGYRQLIDEAEATIETVGADEAFRRQDQAKAVLVDLRDIRELQREGRIPGAIHCPRGMLEFWIDPASPYHKPVFAEDRPFIFFCAAGWRSALAAGRAAEMGLTPVAHIEGGFGAWKKAGLPVESPAEDASPSPKK